MNRTFIKQASVIMIIVLLFSIITTMINSTETKSILDNKIISLESKIDSLSNKKDSIKTIVITIEKEIDKNNKNYEKVVNTIINSNDSINAIWIENYLKQYKQNLK
jgi:biopolymer transport protein ExbB/TolQ